LLAVMFYIYMNLFSYPKNITKYLSKNKIRKFSTMDI